MLAEVLEVTLQVGDRLDRQGVPWVVGGSFASSILGVPAQRRTSISSPPSSTTMSSTS